MKSLLIILLLSLMWDDTRATPCPAGWTESASVPGYCFQFVNDTTQNFADAKAHCKTLHPDAYLYEMRTPARQAYMASLGLNGTQIALGLIKVGMAQWVWEESGLTSAIYWKSGDPGYVATDPRECAGTYVNDPTLISDVFCQWKRKFVCEMKMPKCPCPGGMTEPALVPGYCFQFVNDTTKNFSETKVHCESLHPDAYLYEMRTPARQAYMASLGLNGTQIALGLIKVAMTEWLWEGSGSTSAIYWKSGDPGYVATDPRECAGTFVNDSTEISDVFCQWKRVFICELALDNPCDCNPCLNGGTCVVGLNCTYTCSCLPGFLPPNCAPSHCEIDLCLVVDQSGSITVFNHTRDFLVEVVQGLDIGSSAIQVGLVGFDGHGHFKFDLDDEPTKAGVIAGISAMVRTTGSTRVSLGIDTATTGCFGNGTGDRPGVPNVMLVSTDGKTTVWPDYVADAAADARAAGITIVAIGVKNPDVPTMNKIVDNVQANLFLTDPPGNHNFTTLVPAVTNHLLSSNLSNCQTVSCPAGMTEPASVPGYCFKFVNRREKKGAADTYCKNLHPDAYLYEMRTPARQAYLATLAPSPTVQIWLGLIKVSMTKWVWEGSGLDQTATPDYWKNGDPGYLATDLRECAGTYVLNQSQYSDIFCKWRRIFICELALVHPCTPNPCLNGGTCTPWVGSSHTCACPAGFVGANCEAATCPGAMVEPALVPAYCFQFVNDTTKNFFDAKAHCKTLHPDAYLYEMRTPARQAYMASLGLNGTQIALGLIKVAMTKWVWEGSWLDLANTPGKDYWKVGDPGYVATDLRECAGTFVNDTTLISDVFCQWKRAFICELPLADPCKCNPCPSGTTCIPGVGYTYTCV